MSHKANINTREKRTRKNEGKRNRNDESNNDNGNTFTNENNCQTPKKQLPFINYNIKDNNMKKLLNPSRTFYIILKTKQSSTTNKI